MIWPTKILVQNISHKKNLRQKYFGKKFWSGRILVLNIFWFKKILKKKIGLKLSNTNNFGTNISVKIFVVKK